MQTEVHQKLGWIWGVREAQIRRPFLRGAIVVTRGSPILGDNDYATSAICKYWKTQIVVPRGFSWGPLFWVPQLWEEWGCLHCLWTEVSISLNQQGCIVEQKTGCPTLGGGRIQLWYSSGTLSSLGICIQHFLFEMIENELTLLNTFEEETRSSSSSFRESRFECGVRFFAGRCSLA